MHDCMKCFQVIQQLIYLPVKQCQIIQLKKLTARVFQTSAFMLHNIFHGTLIATGMCILLTEYLVICLNRQSTLGLRQVHCILLCITIKL